MSSSIFQTPEWEQFKLQTGYQKSYRIDGILVLQRELAFGRTMLYSPMVSEKNYESRIKNHAFIKEIKRIAQENRAIFYRLELDIPIIHDSKFMIPKGFVKAFEEMQPENNWIVPIEKSEEEILATMKQKGRYNIKLAQRNEIKVTSSNQAGKELDIFYDLHTKTGRRKNVTFRAKAYFEKLLDILGKVGYAKAYAATGKVEGKDIPLAASVIIFYESEALYLYGGSSDEYKNLMAPYQMHWQIIKDAKECGCKRYNLLGIAPNDDEKHPWAGITRFKKQFGGEQEDILGSYDLIFKPLEYQVFKTVEKIRRH